MPEQVPNYEALPFSLGGPSVAFPGVATPHQGTNGAFDTVVSLKELTEVLTRQRGRVDDSAVLVSELKAFWAAVSTLLRNLQVGIDGELTNYYTSAEVDSLLTAYYTAAQVNAILTSYYTSTEVDTLLAAYYTAVQIDTILADYSTTAVNDVTYLKLDATNGPITNPLEIQGAITATGVIENINSVPKTANYTVTVADDNILCNTSAGAFTVTLPAAPETGRVYTIILETAGNPLTIDGNGNNIDGAATGVLDVAGDAVQLIFNGTQWSLK